MTLRKAVDLKGAEKPANVRENLMVRAKKVIKLINDVPALAENLNGFVDPKRRCAITQTPKEIVNELPSADRAKLREIRTDIVALEKTVRAQLPPNHKESKFMRGPQ